MTDSRRVEHFMADMQKLIDRFRAEYEMTYAEAVGCLEILKSDLIDELRQAETDDEDHS